MPSRSRFGRSVHDRVMTPCCIHHGYWLAISISAERSIHAHASRLRNILLALTTDNPPSYEKHEQDYFMYNVPMRCLPNLKVLPSSRGGSIDSPAMTRPVVTTHPPMQAIESLIFTSYARNRYRHNLLTQSSLLRREQCMPIPIREVTPVVENNSIN